MVSSTSSIDLRTYRVLSKPSFISTSAGKVKRICSTFLWMASTIWIWLEPGCGITAMEIIGFKSRLKKVLLFSGESSALPTSENFTERSPSSLMIKLLKSSSVVIRPCVLTVNSVFAPSILPEGNSIFCFANAFTISGAVKRKEAKRSGSMCKRIAYFCSPHNCTELTPGIVWNFSLIFLVASSFNESKLRVEENTLML